MQGNRIDAIEGDKGWPFPDLKPGEYGKDEDGVWYCVPPGSPEGVLGCLGDGLGNKGHKVTEHEDKSITASPSILISNGQGWSYHGYLERGIWREC